MAESSVDTHLVTFVVRQSIDAHLYIFMRQGVPVYVPEHLGDMSSIKLSEPLQ